MNVLTNCSKHDGGAECNWAVVIQTEGFGLFGNRDSDGLLETCGDSQTGAVIG